jgi:hypothetical protein
MRNQRLLIVLTVVNFVLLAFSLAQSYTVAAQDASPVLRGRGLQIVDDHGRVRASIQVLPSTTQSDGSLSMETVLLRLITEKGRPSVKIGASEESSGLALVGPSGTRDTYVQLGAKGKASSLTLKSEDGRQQVITP